MRPSVTAALVMSLWLTVARFAVAAGDAVPDYSGWQITVTGVETVTATAHYNWLSSHQDDKFTMVMRGSSKYLIEHQDAGEKYQRFSSRLISSHTEYSVGGQGKQVERSQGKQYTRTWSYILAPEQHLDPNACCISADCGGVPQTSPEEPMFMFREFGASNWLPSSNFVRGNPAGDSGNALPAAFDAIRELEGWTPRPKPKEFAFQHRLDTQHLTASGSRAIAKAGGDAVGQTWDYTAQVTYNVVATPATGTHAPPKVELAETDRSWWPEDKNSLNAHIMVHGGKTAKAFRLTLYDVSKEPGTCCNSTDENKDPDLSFAPDAGGWSVEDNGDQWVATSDKGGTDATIKIACHDWGAWGKLKGEAKIGDNWVPAKTTGGALDYARIPYDDDDDHIADSWQALYGVGGKSAKDDSGKKPVTQANDGDGLSLYEDYRGFEVPSAGGKDHVSFDPTHKVLFFIDKSGYFDPDLWEQCSGIKAYALTDETTRPGPATPDGARKVNFRSSYAKRGDKFCVVVTPVKGLYKDADGELPMGDTSGPGGGCPTCPRDVASLYLYPDNALSWINTFTLKLGIAATQPNSAEAKDFATLGLPPGMLKSAYKQLSEGYRQQLVDQGMRQTAIHEMGHCCGLMGHYKKGDPKQTEISIGNKSCPMYYANLTDGLQYIVLQVLMNPGAALPAGVGKFCQDDDFNCWGHLNVKDSP